MVNKQASLPGLAEEAESQERFDYLDERIASWLRQKHLANEHARQVKDQESLLLEDMATAGVTRYQYQDPYTSRFRYVSIKSVNGIRSVSS